MNKNNNKKKPSVSKLAFIGLFALISQGCATVDVDVQGNTSAQALRTDVQYTIKKGDRLGDISNAVTGKVSLWKNIAAYNDITDPRTLKAGDVIIIPAALIPDTHTYTASEEQRLLSKRQSIAAASKSTAQSSIAASSALALVQSNVSADDTQAQVFIKPVIINRTFELNPINESDLVHSSFSDQGPGSPLVKVIGSYYPKGLYEQPASYSTLIMRVAPGTVFELESKVNDWYKVVTDDGVAYLRINDGVILDN